MAEIRDAHEDILFAPIEHSGRGFYWAVACLSVLILWGAIAYAVQFTEGLGVTGLHQPVSWGFYVTNFVFFIGISHAGTLISAILRLSKAEWRRPITRMAEVITCMVIFVGAGQILVDLGRPDRMMNVLRHGRYQSPLLWDATSISAYLTASLTYLYLPMIPDIAILRDRLGKVGTVVGCDTSNCGACTVLLNGYSVKSCSVLAVQADGGDVITVEGLSRDGGKLHPVQEAFRDNHALQCGFCTPGMIMQTIDLLAEDPDPDEAAVRVGLEGNLCRCTGYQNIVRAVQDAAQRLRATATDDTAADAKAVAAKADTAGGVR